MSLVRLETAARARWRSLDALPPAATAGLVFAVLSLVYLATATYDTRQSVDAIAAAFPAWTLATDGSLDLRALVGPDPIWFVDTDWGVVSNRAVGIILFAVPVYWVAQLFTEAPTLVPAAVAAALATAGGIAILHLAFRRLVPPTAAVAAALVAGLATGSWAVSADALWPHGIGQLWLALAVLLTAAERPWSTGLAYAAGVLTRPVVVVAAAVAATVQSWARRSWNPALAVGVLTSLALLGVAGYHGFVFGEPSLTGGYANDFDGTFWSMGALEYGRNLAFTLVSHRGVFLWSPFLLWLVPGLRTAWRVAPTWVRSAALGGLVYMVVHLRLNRYTGGDAFWGYRYPLEALTMAAPLLLLSYREWTATTPQRRRFFAKLVVLSVVFQGAGAAFYHLAL